MNKIFYLVLYIFKLYIYIKDVEDKMELVKNL